MRVCAVVSTKGGVGKTTVAANLGGLLADAGLRVLLIDLDIQPTLSTYYDLEHVAPGGVYELLATEIVDLDQVVSRTQIPSLDVIVSNDPRSQLHPLLLNSPNGRFRMIGLLERFRSRYDLILIDTQGARSVLLEMAVLASDHILSPIAPEILTAREFVRGTQGMMNDLAELARYTRFDVPPLSIVFNRMGEQFRDSRQIAASMREMFAEQNDLGIRVIDPVLTLLTAYRTAASLGLPVHRVEPRRPANRKSPACADQMKTLAVELFPEWAEDIQAVGAKSAKAAGKGVSRGLH